MRLRASRLAEVLKEELSALFKKGIKDPRLDYFSITDIEVSNDLRLAKVFVVTVGQKNTPEQLMAGLEKANGFLRKELSKRLNIRYVPELRFIYDTSLDRSDRIFKLLKDLDQEKEN